MRHDTHFNYNGEWSYDMGIQKVHVNGGLYDDELISSKRIIEEKIEGRDRPYFYGVDSEPLSFYLEILFEQNLTTEKVREILRWLNQSEFKPYYTNSEPDRWLYVMPVNDIRIIHNGILDGYLSLEMRADSPTTLTPYSLTDVYEFRNNSNGSILEIENTGDFDCYPIVHITKVGNGDLTIENLSYSNGEFKFTGLDNSERLYVDCENKEIITDHIRHRYNSFSNNYLKLARGINQLKVVGNCDLQFEMEFRTY